MINVISSLNSTISHPFKKTLSALCFGLASTSLIAGNNSFDTEVAKLEKKPGMNVKHQAKKAKNNHFGHQKLGYVNKDDLITGNIFDIDNLAYYGDWDDNRVYIIDLDNMALVTTVENTGDGPYGIDQQGINKAYALTRKTNSLTIVDNYTFENDGKIELKHKPRSTNFNANTLLSLVSASDKAMTSIIRTDKNKVVKEIGKNELTTPHDFGGSLSTGHPLWVNAQHFFMLDRAGRTIELWNKKGSLLSTIDTPTSIHHIFQAPAATMKSGEEEIYYAVIEGNQSEQVSPGIMRFSIEGNKINKTAQVNLYDYAPDSLELNTMGSHHADFHPNGVHIYIGSTEGHVFVINKNTMAVETMIETGLGSGHTTFLPMRNQAIVTNHNATYMTLIDTVNHQAIRNIEVASSASPNYKSQSHTSGVSLDMKYFYSAASYDGTFFRIDLDSWDIDRLFVGGNILMGSFILNDEGINM